MSGRKTAVIDFDIGLRNLDIVMGCERRVVFDIINVLQGEANLHQALIKDKHCENLHILAASQTRDKKALSLTGVSEIFSSLSGMGFDYIICDSPAGIETGALVAMHHADAAIVVTNPDVASISDSKQIIEKLDKTTKRSLQGGMSVKKQLLVTRFNSARVDAGEMLSVEDINELLPLELIGIIPESNDILTASNHGTPAIHLKNSDVSLAYRDAVNRFLGAEIPLRMPAARRASFFQKIIRRQ
jgi:septum site-determining protein MinD